RAQISARKKTNQEIRESKTFLDSVIENIPNMIFVKSADELRFLRFNRAGEEIIGRSRSEMIGKNDYDFFPKEQADFFTAKDRMVLQGKKAIDIPEEPISTSKGIRILHTKKIPVFSDNGTAQYLLGISEDITEKKAAELARISLLREQAARREAERSAQQLRFFGHASNALSESLDLDSMLMAFSRVILSNLAKVVRID